MILGNFVQSGFCLGLLGRDLALSDRAHGSCRDGNLGGGRRAAAPSSLGTRCDRAVWKDELAPTELSEGLAISAEFSNRPMSNLQRLNSCLR